MSACSTSELMVCELAARLHDDEIVIIGGASPVPMAAALLAQRTTAPDLTLLTGSGAVNPRPSHLAPSGGDYAYVAGAEAYFTMEDVFDDTERGRWDVGIFGGIQVDPYGNFNLTFVGGTLAAPRFRGPGLVNAGLPASIARSMLCVGRHTTGGLRRADRLRVGRGHPPPRRQPLPRRPPRGRAGLLRHRPGLARLQRRGRPHGAVLAASGRRGRDRARAHRLCPSGPPDPPVTAAPAEAMLEVLRRSVDPTGVLRAAAVAA